MVLDMPREAWTAKIRLERDPGFAEWARRACNPARYVYNRAVSECLFSGDRMERVVADLPAGPDAFWLPEGPDDITYGSLAMDGAHHEYCAQPTAHELRRGIYNNLTRWRSEAEWLRGCPTAYERGAIAEAVAACRKAVEDHADRPPYLPEGGHIEMSSVVAPIRLGDRTLRIPGYGTVRTATPVDPSWEMRLFCIVEVSGRADPADRTFELRVAVRGAAKEPAAQADVPTAGRMAGRMAGRDGQQPVGFSPRGAAALMAARWRRQPAQGSALSHACGGVMLDADGEMVCGRCGVVAGYWTEAPEDPTAPPAGALDYGGLSTTMGMSNSDHAGGTISKLNMHRLRKRNTWTQRYDRSLPAAMAQLSTLRDRLGMTGACTEYAAYLFRRAASSGFLVGRVVSHCTAAVALLACRKHGIGRTIHDVMGATGVPRRDIYRTYRQLFERFDPDLPLPDPVSYIARIGETCHISETARREACRILMSMDRMEATGKDPMGLAAGALYVACVRHGEPVFRAKIAAATGVAETTLSMRYGELAAVAEAARPAEVRLDCRHGRTGDGGR